MLSKSYSKTGRMCRVIFNLPEEVQATTASLCGEFNEWNPTAHLMKKLKNGGFSIAISLEAGKTYRFKYLLDGRRWENDWAADGYVSNRHGTEDSLVRL